MDKEKTGALIAEMRRQKGMTQQELASKLYVTDKAVSKWERGLSFPGVYISERGSCPQLMEYVEQSRDVKFVEQGGSGYIFSNGVDRLVVVSEVYFGRFTVWQVPQHTLQSPG